VTTPARPARILIADDDPDVLAALRLLLRGEGFEVETVGSPARVIAAVEGDDFDAALLDLNYARDTTSGREGVELVGRLRDLDPTLPVIVMTGNEGAVEPCAAASTTSSRTTAGCSRPCAASHEQYRRPPPRAGEPAAERRARRA
jgi:CheY-like chemotaxis protein